MRKVTISVTVLTVGGLLATAETAIAGVSALPVSPPAATAPGLGGVHGVVVNPGGGSHCTIVNPCGWFHGTSVNPGGGVHGTVVNPGGRINGVVVNPGA